MLAAFLGFELIRKVSPLLHTPLMSLTNAIASISVVGAIIVSGDKAPQPCLKVLGLHRRRFGDHQPRQRLPHHRPHVEDV